MKRTRRWIRRMVMAVAGCAVAVVGLYVLVLPAYVRGRIRTELAHAGFPVAAFNLRNVSIAGMEIEQVALGRPQWLGADRIKADYSIGSLWHGRIREASVTRARWEVQMKDGAIDLGELGSALKLSSNSGASSMSHDLPFDRLELHDSEVVLDCNGQSYRAAIEGSIIRSSPGRFELKLNANGLPSNATWIANGWIDLAGDSPRFQINASVPSFELSDASLVQQFMPALRRADLGGTYALEAKLDYENGRLQPLVELRFDGIRLEKRAWPASVQSASGAITFDSFAPFSTAGTQHLTISKAKYGKLDITDASIDFALERPDSITVQRATWSLGDYGRFEAAEFQFNPLHPRIATQVNCDSVGLGGWLALLTNGSAAGDGRLRGSMGLVIDPAAPNPVLVSAGGLNANPQTGWIQTSQVEQLKDLLAESFSADERLAQVRDKVITALKDFEFDAFSIGFQPEDQGDLLCVIQTQGRGRQGPSPQEIGGLTINIHNFNTLLSAALEVGSGISHLE